MKHSQAMNEKVASIFRVPRSILPIGAAKDFLLEQAAAGEDVYAYAPMQLQKDPEKQRWNLWLRDERWALEVWVARFYREKASGGDV